MTGTQIQEKLILLTIFLNQNNSLFNNRCDCQRTFCSQRSVTFTTRNQFKTTVYYFTVMLPGPARILTCPYCGAYKEVMSLITGNTYGQEVWSENKTYALMNPEVLFVQRF